MQSISRKKVFFFSMVPKKEETHKCRSTGVCCVAFSLSLSLSLDLSTIGLTLTNNPTHTHIHTHREKKKSSDSIIYANDSHREYFDQSLIFYLSNLLLYYIQIHLCKFQFNVVNCKPRRTSPFTHYKTSGSDRCKELGAYMRSLTQMERHTCVW